ncbi:MAG: hypothetical protein WAM70_09285 [Pyrinomonadaceae bacterium]
MISNQTPATTIRYTIAFSFAALLAITNVAAQTNRAGQTLAVYLNWSLPATDFLSALSMKEKTSATVTVDCTKGESINEALTKSPTARNLTVEITGMCTENVVVTRDHVTLHGTNPANDGIQADFNDEISDVALWVRGAELVTVENLKLTGGFSGLLATNTGLTNLHLINCRLENNAAYGMQSENALVQADDTTFSTNGNINAGIFAGSRLQCTNCTLANPQGSGPLGTTRVNAFVFGANRLLLFNSTLTNGGITSDDSLILVTDSTITGLPPGANTIFAFGSSAVVLTRVTVNGSMTFNQGANGQLLGVTQVTTINNQMDDSAYVRIGDASPAAGGPPSIPSSLRGFIIRNFSKVSLLQTSSITGNFNCSQGADVFCTTPANISGTSNCGQCPKP